MFGESAEHLAKEGAEVLEEEAEQGLKRAGHLAEEEAEKGLRRAGNLAEEETEKSLRRTGDLAEEEVENGVRHGSDALDEAAAGCRFTCFAEGTLVSTPKGEVPIEQIAVGDQVYSYDEETGEEHPAEVVALHHRDVTELWLLQVGGETIETTDEHPFYVVGQGWTRAKDLREGDVLIATSGNRLPLEKVERVEQTARVYNFEVRDLHTYLVGRVGAVVHNCGTGGLERNDRVLRQNLGGVEEGYTAHHLIGVADAPNYPVMHQAAGLGYDINRASNGIALPNSSDLAKEVNFPYHPKRGRHAANYTDFVNEELGKLQQRYDAGLVGDHQLLDAVREIEDATREGLLSGKLRLNSRYSWYVGR